MNADDWYYREPHGSVVGPLKLAQIQNLVREKIVEKETPVSFGKSGEWVPAARAASLWQSGSSQLSCPYCDHFIGYVRLRGQLVTCPNCHSQVKTVDATPNAYLSQIVVGIVIAVGGLLLMLRGCAFFELRDAL